MGAGFQMFLDFPSSGRQASRSAGIHGNFFTQHCKGERGTNRQTRRIRSIFSR